jgi:hypothetical protein
VGVAAVAGLLCWTLGAPLEAQSRAALQVAAEVVQITPSAVALDRARGLAVGTAPGSGSTSLATIAVVTDSLTTPSDRRRSARVVTIEFLSN